MRIRMTEQRSGPRWDNRMWPERGGEIDVDDEEGAAICGAGWAVPVVAEKAPPVETRPADETTVEKRGPGRPRKTTE